MLKLAGNKAKPNDVGMRKGFIGKREERDGRGFENMGKQNTLYTCINCRRTDLIKTKR